MAYLSQARPETLDWLLEHGVEGLLLLLLLLFLGAIVTDPSRAERWAALFWRLVYKLFKRGELRIVKHEVDGNVNRFFQEDLFPDLVNIDRSKIRVKWVASATDSVFQRKGTVIVKLRHHEDKYQNILSATLAALPRILHPLARPFIGRSVEEAIDLQVCRRLASSLGPGADNVFALEFLRPRLEKDPNLREILQKLLQIDTAGLFVPVFLQEVAYVGAKFEQGLTSASPDTVDDELLAFLRFLLAIAEREPGEELTLCFVRDSIRTGVILVARAATRAYGVGPYVRRLGKNLAIGCQSVYVLATEDNIPFAEEVAEAIGADRRAVLEKRRRIKLTRLGERTHGFYAAFRVDPEYLSAEEFSRVVKEAGLESGKEFQGMAVNVADEFAQVEIAGLLGRLDKKDVSWKQLASCRELIAEGDEFTVHVLRVDEDTRELEVGLKQVREENPWPDVAERYRPGTKAEGKVTRIEPYGVYVEIEPGIEGLVHETALRAAGYEYADFQETIVPGQVLYVVIRKVWRGKQKISLELQRTYKETPRAM